MAERKRRRRKRDETNLTQYGRHPVGARGPQPGALPCNPLANTIIQARKHGCCPGITPAGYACSRQITPVRREGKVTVPGDLIYSHNGKWYHLDCMPPGGERPMGQATATVVPQGPPGGPGSYALPYAPPPPALPYQPPVQQVSYPPTPCPPCPPVTQTIYLQESQEAKEAVLGGGLPPRRVTRRPQPKVQRDIEVKVANEEDAIDMGNAHVLSDAEARRQRFQEAAGRVQDSLEELVNVDAEARASAQETARAGVTTCSDTACGKATTPGQPTMYCPTDRIFWHQEHAPVRCPMCQRRVQHFDWGR